MSTNRASQVDLAKLFNTVTRELKANQETLNASDEYNHNHGDNMVENFQVITQAMRQSNGESPSEQLAYASQALAQRSQTSSAQLYSQGLAQAAEQMRGQSIITPENAMLLVQSLMGGQASAQPGQGGTDLLGGLLGSMGGQAQGAPQGQAPGGEDLLGSLLGGMGGQTQSAPQDQTAGSGDLLGGLLGALMGGQPQVGQGSGVDLNMLMSAGMAFFQARQQGAGTVQALAQAAMTGSQMYGTTHHSQSGELVAQTLINTLGSMLSGRK